MRRLFVEEDPAACRRLWLRAFEPRVLTDLWEVRECFQRAYQRPLRFVACEENERLVGLLPLSLIDETGSSGFFPGETWEGRTWLEQNRLLAESEEILDEMLGLVDRHVELRYLLPDDVHRGRLEIDEVGYLFNPPDFGWDMEKYFDGFRWKTLKGIRKEIAALTAPGLHFRLDRPGDFDLLVEMNRSRFAQASYFSDDRFLEGFTALMELLKEMAALRLTTVMIGGVPAAVDMGCVYKGVYTLLAGGTHPEFPGVAKLINLHHMERSCAERFESADFLCGNFHWKSLFHLRERPLYKLTHIPVPALPVEAIELEVEHA